jgi:hypothetical protein
MTARDILAAQSSRALPDRRSSTGIRDAAARGPDRVAQRRRPGTLAVLAAGNLGVAVLLLATRQQSVTWVVSIAAALRMAGIAWTMAVTPVQRPEDASRTVIDDLGLADQPGAIALSEQWGMSWFFDTENWAPGIWNSWAEARTDRWREAMEGALPNRQRRPATVRNSAECCGLIENRRPSCGRSIHSWKPRGPTFVRWLFGRLSPGHTDAIRRDQERVRPSSCRRSRYARRTGRVTRRRTPTVDSRASRSHARSRYAPGCDRRLALGCRGF